jgi:hypothetical protein
MKRVVAILRGFFGSVIYEQGQNRRHSLKSPLKGRVGIYNMWREVSISCRCCTFHDGNGWASA